MLLNGVKRKCGLFEGLTKTVTSSRQSNHFEIERGVCLVNLVLWPDFLCLNVLNFSARRVLLVVFSSRWAVQRSSNFLCCSVLEKLRRFCQGSTSGYRVTLPYQDVPRLLCCELESTSVMDDQSTFLANVLF